MKAEILNILRMQQDGKLTQDQAAELLAVLADQAREKDAASTQNAPTGEAPGPRGKPEPGPADRGFNVAAASAAFHGLIDTAMGVGATVGRAATVWGTEFLQMVHRDEGGNSVTLSKVDSPHGDGFSFRDNTINVSKVSDLNFSQAQISGNTINASKVSHLAVTRGRFVQCNISGSSLGSVTIEGPAEAIVAGTGEGTVPTGIRAVTFNASKFARVRISGSSTLETCTIQATAAKDWVLTENASLKDSRINDSHVAGMHLERTAAATLCIERSNIQSLVCRDAALESVTFSGVRFSDVTITGGRWTRVKFHREPASSLGGRETFVNESTFENCTLTDCDFAGCTFRRTTLRNLNLTGISIRNIDFTAMKLETQEDFRRAAGI